MKVLLDGIRFKGKVSDLNNTIHFGWPCKNGKDLGYETTH